MKRDIQATDPIYEQDKGRIAVWLDPADIQWLATHCCCPLDATEDVKERCLRIRFRANAALHKSGLKSESIEVTE